jgi:hypothetical protein
MADLQTAIIYLKSGSEIRVELENLVTTKTGLGELTKLRWEGLVGAQIMHLDFDQIAAIVVRANAAPASTVDDDAAYVADRDETFNPEDNA